VKILLKLAKWTGIPIMKMLQGEREKLLHLEEEHRRVVGQEEGMRQSVMP
jgi:ATP-dependent Clp protease ATP-binding subunit ClpB